MSKPIFDQPYGLKYQVDGIRMELSWRPDFGAEKRPLPCKGPVRPCAGGRAAH